jgi:hypothetical protein
MRGSALGPDGWALLDLVQIRTEKRFGSGLLVGPGLVLTALHCVADPENDWSRYGGIGVNLWRDLVGSQGKLPKEHSYRATVVWHPDVDRAVVPPDIALLKLDVEQDEQLPHPMRNGPLFYAQLGLGDSKVVTTGFPELLKARHNAKTAIQKNPLPGDRGEGAFSGWANLFQSSSPTISFTSRLITSQAGWEPWSGLSGGPLFRGNALVGVMRGGQPQFRVDRNLEAEPLAPLLRDRKFKRLAEMLGAQEEDDGPVSRAGLAALKDVIANEGVSNDAIRDAYLVSYLSATVPAEPTAEPNAGLIDDVAAHGVPALQRFLTRLVAKSDGVRSPIEKWVSQQPNLAGFQFNATLPAPPNDDPVVLIKVLVTAESIKCTSASDCTYVVEAWILDGANDARPIDPGEGVREIKHGFGKLPELIQTFVTRSLERLPTSATPRVELALPFELLDEAIERWLIKRRLVHQSLGTRFPIALRSCDRLYDRDLWYHWRESWKGLPAKIGDNELHWIVNADGWGEQLFYAINGRPLIPVGLGCGGADGIGMLVEAGAPIAIWLRDPPYDETAARDEIRKLVCGLPVRDLPSAMRNQRAVKPGSAQWDGVALLYDDPTRLPPDTHMQMRSY